MRINILKILRIALISLVSGVTGLPAENLTLTINASAYQISDLNNGRQIIKMDGFGFKLTPGKPMLPAKSFMIALPPGAEVISVTTENNSSVELDGIYDITPAPPNSILYVSDSLTARFHEEWQRNYDFTYSSDQIYPEKSAEYMAQGMLRKYSYARVAYYPFSYKPESGKLTLNPSVNVTIEYEIAISDDQNMERLLADTKADARASEIFVNYAEAELWYQSSGYDKSRDTIIADYLIITADYLTSAVQPLVDWKNDIGYKVKRVPTIWIEGNYSGADLQEKIRNFLIDKYIEWQIEYVLLVGDIDLIPMRKCYADSADHDPSGWFAVPTDFYYADLTGDWDSDGDGYSGEFGQDDIDLVAEVYVGRIPWSTDSIVTNICEKLVAYESDTGDWKNNALLLAAFSNFENQDFSGYPETDGATTTEEIITDILPGWDIFTMYEQRGLVPSNYPCSYPLTHDNAIDEWSGNPYAVVIWSAHGAFWGSATYTWDWDDGDGVPESDKPAEISWEAFISLTDIPFLDNDHSSIIFASSCWNGQPEVASLAKELLRHGSAGIVSSTRPAYYTKGWQDESWGRCASTNYYFNLYLIGYGQKAGEALYNSKTFYLNNLFSEWPDQHNMFCFNLYGDPALTREGIAITCGDANSDETVNVSDAVYIINYVFVGGDPPSLPKAGDANCDDVCNVSDAVWIINYVFIGGNDPCDMDGNGEPDC
jgi:hypothetical protein